MSNFQRKHYLTIARVLRGCRPRGYSPGWVGAVVALANELRDDNPEFKAADFVRACGLSFTEVWKFEDGGPVEYNHPEKIGGTTSE